MTEIESPDEQSPSDADSSVTSDSGGTSANTQRRGCFFYIGVLFAMLLGFFVLGLVTTGEPLEMAKTVFSNRMSSSARIKLSNFFTEVLTGYVLACIGTGLVIVARRNSDRVFEGKKMRSGLTGLLSRDGQQLLYYVIGACLILCGILTACHLVMS